MILQRVTYFLLTLFMFLTGVAHMSAQNFSVSSFKVLPNDVSGFINPVRDLNDEDCGLLKVIGSGDFVFSTPLGIVKREDKPGEIWLYLPRNSKKITLKHAEWGVLRDYMFPMKIDSHITYEMRISEPPKPKETAAAEPIIMTVRDTLVMTRIDTVVIQPTKKHIPLEFDAALTATFGGKSKALLGGVFIAALKRHGGFIHLNTDFGSVPSSTSAECDKNGIINGKLPFYTGHTRHSAFMFNAGAAHRLSSRVGIFEGVGYSRNVTAWQLAQSEGGGFVRNSYYSVSGVSFEAGAMLTFKNIKITASVISIKGIDWYGSLGIGIRFGKKP